jgi:hypothetical protein
MSALILDIQSTRRTQAGYLFEHDPTANGSTDRAEGSLTISILNGQYTRD